MPWMIRTLARQASCAARAYSSTTSGHSRGDDLRDLVGSIQLRDVLHHDRLVRELRRAFDHLVEVDVTSGARALERLAAIEERALRDEHARTEQLRAVVVRC